MVKERITLHDQLKVFRLLSATGGILSRLWRHFQAAKILTGRYTIKGTFNLKDIIPKKQQENQNVDYDTYKKKLINVCSNVGSRCNKLPIEILDGMTDTELEVYSIHLLIRYYENLTAAVYAAHAPKEAVDDAKKQIKHLNSKIKVVTTSAQFDDSELIDDSGVNALFNMHK